MLIAIDPQKFSVLYNSESKRNPFASDLYDLQGNSVIQKRKSIAFLLIRECAKKPALR